MVANLVEKIKKVRAFIKDFKDKNAYIPEVNEAYENAIDCECIAEEIVELLIGKAYYEKYKEWSNEQ